MPQYLFESTETGETASFFYHMKDAPKVGTVIEIDGGQWRRIFTVPQASIDTKIDPFSQAQFRDKTSNKRGTLGDAWDASAELSAKRAEKEGGADPVKEKFFSTYKKERRGTPHTQELKRNHEAAQKKLNDGLNKIAKQLGLD